MEFHNKIMWNSRIVCKEIWNSIIFLTVHVENRSFEIIPHACSNFQTKAFGEETKNETTKNRTQHDQGSLNKRSACSMYFWLLHWLLIKGASGELLSDCIPSKRLSKACLEKLLEAVEILEYNSNCSNLNF